MDARRAMASSALLLASVLSACGGDDSDNTKTTIGQSTTAPVAPNQCGDSHPQVLQQAGWCERRSGITEFANVGPQCIYRKGALLVPKGFDEQALNAALAGGIISRRHPFETIGYVFVQYDGGADPAVVASSVEGVSPDYLFASSMGWTFVPASVATPAPSPSVTPLSSSSPTITVLDTAWATAPPVTSTALNMPPQILNALATAMLPPPMGPEVTIGETAGHGTFIASILRRLLPAATIQVGQVPSWEVNVQLPGFAPYVTSVMSTFSVLLALEHYKPSGIDYLNLSFGSYGCPDDVPKVVDKENNPKWRSPFPVHDAILPLLQQTPQERIFAAAGNDASQEPFYPAAWTTCVAPPTDVYGCASSPGPAKVMDDQIISVGSTDCAVPCATRGAPYLMGGLVFTNSGPWVETYKDGSEVVAHRPDTWSAPGASIQPAGFYEWSGTSFATPCALALHVASRPADTDCGLGAPPGPTTTTR